MGLAYARTALRTAIAVALRQGGATNTVVRGNEPPGEELRATIKLPGSFVSIVPVRITDQSRIALARIAQINNSTNNLKFNVVNGVITPVGDNITTLVNIVVTTAHRVVNFGINQGDPSTLQTLMQTVSDALNYAIQPPIPNTISGTTVYAPGVTSVTVNEPNIGSITYEVGRDVALMKVTIYAPSLETRDAMFDMINSRVGSTLQNRLLLGDNTYALLFKENAIISDAMEDTYGAFTVNINYTMDYAVTLDDLATPVAATDIKLSIDGSDSTDYIF